MIQFVVDTRKLIADFSSRDKFQIESENFRLFSRNKLTNRLMRFWNI
jgi:hypothetical protein